MRRAAVLLVIAAAAACGKKGPPLPPLILVPAAPASFAAERRADAVDLRFVVPRENVDGTRPADVARVDVYALVTTAVPAEGAAENGPRWTIAASADEVLERGVRIGSVNVRPPVDEDEETTAAAAPVTDVAVAPDGVDQGATAHVSDDLAGELSGQTPAASSAEPPIRAYVAVAVSARGRRSAFSPVAAVPLGAAPSAPPQPAVSYDAGSITVAWKAAAGATNASDDLRFHVYEVEPVAAAAADRATRRLTENPVAAAPFVDKRIEWGAQRCYTVSAVRSVAGFLVESEAADPQCVTLRDTFAPAPPTGLTALATEGAISLIWEPPPDDDVAGYVVLRAAPGGEFAAITPAPVQQRSFRDEVPAGTRYRYAVRAVDTAGNQSEPSAPVEDVAR